MSNAYVTAIIDDRLDAYLQRMADSGLYGEDRSDVLVFALQTAVQAAVAAGIIKLTPPDEEPPVPAPKFSPSAVETMLHDAGELVTVIRRAMDPGSVDPGSWLFAHRTSLTSLAENLQTSVEVLSSSPQAPDHGPNCAHVRTDCPCEKPGCLGDEIPF